MAEVKRYFKPEFVNRIDEIIVFNALNEEMLAKIAHKFMNELSERLAHRKTCICRSAMTVYRLIATQGVDPVYGARPMKRYIQRSIETLIARTRSSRAVPARRIRSRSMSSTVNMRCTIHHDEA